MREILIFENTDELISAAAELFLDIGTHAIAERGRFVVALSGGSTPRPVYELLADKYSNRLDWKRVFFFLGDERHVPLDSTESNFRMVNETLFSPLALATDNLHPWPIDLGDPEKIAKGYGDEIESFFGGYPRFDLVFLGLGTDCHTASLFPHTDALRESSKIAVANHVEKLGAHRLTLTFPVINNAADVIFVVSGEDKAPAVGRVLEGEFRPDDMPAQFVNPTDGNLYWLLDRSAASELNRPAD